LQTVSVVSIDGGAQQRSSGIRERFIVVAAKFADSGVRISSAWKVSPLGIEVSIRTRRAAAVGGRSNPIDVDSGSVFWNIDVELRSNVRDNRIVEVGCVGSSRDNQSWEISNSKSVDLGISHSHKKRQNE
jgi:hypothetical protein